MKNVLPSMYCLLTIVMMAAPRAEAKRAFAIPDQFRIVKVAGPEMSPDGQWLAYVSTYFDLENNKRWSHIWLVDKNGHHRRQLTQTEAMNSSPRWSPSGKQIAYLSGKDKNPPQLFLMSLAGGEPKKLSNFPKGVANPVWSPDGTVIAITAQVYPECGADTDCNQKIFKSWTKGPLQAHLADALLYRHWESWRDGAYRHILLLSLADNRFNDLTPGHHDAPPFSVSGGTKYAFAPDGKELTFTSNHDEKQAESTNSDLWQIGIKDAKPAGPARRLTTNPAWDSSPAYSPDGTLIAYRLQKEPGYESDRFRLALYNRKSKSHQVLSEKFDNWIEDFRWAPDGKSIIFLALENGRMPLFQYWLRSKKITPLLKHGFIVNFVMAPNGKDLFFASHGVDRPTEIYRKEADQAEAKQISHENDALRDEVDFRPMQEKWVSGAGSRKIHTFLVKPPGFDPAKRYPVILKVHGGPQGMYGDAYNPDYQVMAGLGYIIAFSNPTGSTGYGQAFTDAIAKDWGGKVFEDLMNVVDYVEKLAYVDKSRIGAMGWSYGGYMMMWFAGHTQRFQALAAMMGVYDLPSKYGATEELFFPEHDLGGSPWDSEEYRKWSPSQFVTQFKTPCLVVTGEKDYRVPYTQSLQFFTALQKRGVPSRLAVLTEAGHGPGWYDMAFYYLLHADWFHRHLGGQAPVWPVEKFLRNQVFPIKPEK